MVSVKPSIYSYQDFSTAFSAYVEWLRSVNSKFSWRWLSKRLNLKSHTHVVNFVNGSKSPTGELLVKISDLFGWSVEEYLYAKYLLGLQTARSETEQMFYRTRLAEVHRPAPLKVMKDDSFRLIADWYHLVLFETMNLPDFRNDATWLSEKLCHAIEPSMAEEAIRRLIRLGLVKELPDGTLQREAEGVFTSNNVSSDAIRNFHKQMLERAAVAIDEVDTKQRLCFGYTMAIDSARMSEAQDLIVDFRNRFAKLMSGGNADTIYHLGIQLFPTTKLGESGSPVTPE